MFSDNLYNLWACTPNVRKHFNLNSIRSTAISLLNLLMMAPVLGSDTPPCSDYDNDFKTKTGEPLTTMLTITDQSNTTYIANLVSDVYPNSIEAIKSGCCDILDTTVKNVATNIAETSNIFSTTDPYCRVHMPVTGACDELTCESFEFMSQVGRSVNDTFVEGIKAMVNAEYSEFRDERKNEGFTVLYVFITILIVGSALYFYFNRKDRLAQHSSNDEGEDAGLLSDDKDGLMDRCLRIFS